jgi:hypothetical protein
MQEVTKREEVAQVNTDATYGFADDFLEEAVRSIKMQNMNTGYRIIMPMAL